MSAFFFCLKASKATRFLDDPSRSGDYIKPV